MNLRRFRPLNTLTMLGLAALALASVVNMVVQRHTTLPERVTDPVLGFMYGVAIATTLLGIWRQGRGMTGRSGCA